jgi:hypothetical protein
MIEHMHAVHSSSTAPLTSLPLLPLQLHFIHLRRINVTAQPLLAAAYSFAVQAAVQVAGGSGAALATMAGLSDMAMALILRCWWPTCRWVAGW